MLISGIAAGKECLMALTDPTEEPTGSGSLCPRHLEPFKELTPVKETLLEPEKTSASSRKGTSSKVAAARKKRLRHIKKHRKRGGASILLAAVLLSLCVYGLSRPRGAQMELPLFKAAPALAVASPEGDTPESQAENRAVTLPDEEPPEDGLENGGTEGSEDAGDAGEAFASGAVPTSSKAGMLDGEVEKVLASIIKSGMTKREQARAIFDFARLNIAYTGSSDKSNWQDGAYAGLTTRRGDCFTYYAVSRALLTALGIDNLEVTRVGGPTSHYWNLVNCGDGWYHFDATPRSSKMPAFVSFMFTDQQAADYTSRAGRNYYTFDGSLYPERAGGSASSSTAETQTPAVNSPAQTETPAETVPPVETGTLPKTENPQETPAETEPPAEAAPSDEETPSVGTDSSTEPAPFEEDAPPADELN